MGEEWNPSSGVDIQRYAAVLWRRRWWVAAVVAAAVLVAGVAARGSGPKRFRASADVLVKPVAMNPLAPPSRVDQAVDLDTESRIVGSTAVATLAGAKLNSPETPEVLAKRVVTAVSADTQVMSVTFNAPTRSGAEKGALAFAQSYLEYKEAAASGTQSRITAELRARIADLDGQVAAASAAMAANTEGTAPFIEAQGTRNVVSSQIGLLHDQLAAYTSVEIDPGVVIRTAAAAPVRSKQIPVPVAGAMGLLAGMAVAFARDRLDNRLHWTRHVRHIGGLPLLAAVPRRTRARRRQSVVDPQSPEAEAFHRLGTNVIAATHGGRAGGKVVVVTSPSPNEGKTTVAANLAVALARSGRRVAVVSADLRRPGLNGAFSLPDGPTVNDLLEGRAGADEVAIRPAAWPGLTVHPSRVSAGHPGQELQSPAMTAFLEELRATHDYVLVDAPPVLPVADTLPLAAAADATVLVARQHRTTDVALAAATGQLARIGANLAGAVVNQTRTVRVTDGYYSYSSEGRRRARRRHELAVAATAGVALVAVAGSAAAVGFGWPGGDKKASAAAPPAAVLGATVTRPPDPAPELTTTTVTAPPAAPITSSTTRPAPTTTSTTGPAKTTTTTVAPTTTTTVRPRIAPVSAVATAPGVSLALDAAPGEARRSVTLRLSVGFSEPRVLRAVRLDYGDGKVVSGEVKDYACHDPAAPNPYVLTRGARQMDRTGAVPVTVTVVTAPCSPDDDDAGPDQTAEIRLTLDVP